MPPQATEITMSSEPPGAPLVDALKASASKLKETKSNLEARARELDALKAQLDGQREELEKQAAKLEADREGLAEARAEAQNARSAVDKDLAAVMDGREKLASEDRRIRDEAKALDARAEAVREDEGRVERLGKAFTDRMRESEARLQALVEREGDLVKMQNDWLAGFEAGSKALVTIIGEMHDRQRESVQQTASLAELQNGLRDELNRLVAEREKLEEKEKSLLEAQSYLTSALETADIAHQDGHVSAPVPPPVPAPVPDQEASEPPAPPETPPAVEYEAPEETVAKPKPTKSEALNRLTKAVESWKRARDAGWDVGDMRKTLMRAKEMLEAGDYETALRVANEMLQKLQAAPLAR
ncbi:MAG: hypothetical protein ACT4OI_04130 [Methanobacteriota archaeon]